MAERVGEEIAAHKVRMQAQLRGEGKRFSVKEQRPQHTHSAAADEAEGSFSSVSEGLPVSSPGLPSFTRALSPTVPASLYRISLSYVVVHAFVVTGQGVKGARIARQKPWKEPDNRHEPHRRRPGRCKNEWLQRSPELHCQLEGEARRIGKDMHAQYHTARQREKTRNTKSEWVECESLTMGRKSLNKHNKARRRRPIATAWPRSQTTFTLGDTLSSA